jgi:hypothetical protein
MTDKHVVNVWWAATGGDKGMNLALIQRPKRVRADTKALYIYAPSVLSEDGKLKAESVIKILEVNEGPTPEETVLKVIEHEVWFNHCRNWYGKSDQLCTKTREARGDYLEGQKQAGPRPECGCEKPLAEMPEHLRNATHFVLLSDIGK